MSALRLPTSATPAALSTSRLVVTVLVSRIRALLALSTRLSDSTRTLPVKVLALLPRSMA